MQKWVFVLLNNPLTVPLSSKNVASTFSVDVIVCLSFNAVSQGRKRCKSGKLLQHGFYQNKTYSRIRASYARQD